jgi:two-component system cell cycle sensor histidine kinase/response regulator CckA
MNGTTSTSPAQHRERSLLAFASLGRRLGAAGTSHEAARIIMDVADSLLGWDACWFDLYSPEENKLYHVYEADVIKGKRVELPPSYDRMAPSILSGRTIKEGPQLILRENSGQMAPTERPFGDTSRPSASLMFAPVRNGNSVTGIISIQSYTASAYDERCLEILQALADHCGGTLDRIRAGEALQERSRLAVFGAEVGLGLTSGRVLREMLRHSAESMVRHFAAASVLIWTVNEQEKILELQACAGLQPAPGSAWDRLPLGQGRIGRLAEDRHPAITAIIAGETDLPDGQWLARNAVVSFAGYPLLVQDRVVGVIAAFGRQPLQNFVLQALASVALQVALGIERKRGEEVLRRTQERLAYLLANSPAVIYAFELDGEKISPVSISDNIETLFGYKPIETLTPTWWAEALHPQDRQSLADWLPELIRLNQVARDYRVRHKDGQYLWVRDERRLVRNPQAKPIEIIGSWMDITERKQLEEQFRQAQKMEAVGQLAGGVAHDFNNLLLVIRGNSELLLLDEAQLPAQAVEGVKQIMGAAVRAAELTRQLLMFGRKQILQPRPVSVNDAVAGMSSMLSRIIRENIHLRSGYGPDLPMIQADPGMIDQILMNLVVNARDAMPQGGELSIRTDVVTFSDRASSAHPEARLGQFVRLSVSDSGEGIAPEHLPRIFEPFFTTKEIGKGTGLGLATVYGIVKQHQGWIEVTSEPGQGSVFDLYFPAIASTAAQPSGPPSSPNVAGGAETILMVEDDESVRVLARRMLQNAGYKVLEATSGKIALELWNAHHANVDLLLADFMLPDGMSGPELAGKFRSEKPGLKIIVTSGYTPETLGSDFHSPEGVTFLPKPFSIQGLLQTIRRCLDNHS